jgi:hypothetical protein
METTVKFKSWAAYVRNAQNESWLFGFLCALGWMMMFMDILGLEGYIDAVRKSWIVLEPIWGFGILFGSWALHTCISWRVNTVMTQRVDSVLAPDTIVEDGPPKQP